MNLSASILRIRQFAPLALVFISAVAAVCAYLQVLDAPFIYDDNIYITHNHRLSELHLNELWRLFTGPYNLFSEFLPLRDLSYWFDISLFGLTPSAFRIHNILLNLLCLPLVYGATLGVWRYFRPEEAASASWAAAAVTALFALHPVLVESVVWVSGRKYVLPNLFSMLALWLAVHTRRERGFSAPYAAATLVAFVAVMLSKTSYIAVAPVIALLWALFWLDIPKPERSRSQLLWPLAILFLAVLLVLIYVASSTTKTPFYFGVEAVTRSLAVLGWLSRLAVSPESRHFFYPVFEDPHLPVMVTFGGVVLASAVVGGVMLLRKRSLEGFAAIAFLLLCMPHMQLIPYAPPSLVSDRFLTLAIWPAMLLIVALSWRLKPAFRAVLLFVIALAWGYQTAERPHDWRSFEAVIDADLRAYPGYYMPAFQKIIWVQTPQRLYRDASETASSIADPEIRNIMLAEVRADYAVNGAALATGKPREAMVLLQNLGLMLKRPPAQTKWNLPVSQVWKFYRSTFPALWGQLVKQFPNDAFVRYSAGLNMLNIPEYEKDAVAHLRAAVESQNLPESVRGDALKNFGIALLDNGQIAEAETQLHAALKQPQPDMRVYCLLSAIYKHTGRFDEAARAEAICPPAQPNRKTVQ